MLKRSSSLRDWEDEEARTMLKGWAGKRLHIDLDLQRVWTDEIPAKDLESHLGGRGLNAKFFLEKVAPSISPSFEKSPLAFSVGPLSGTFAPCSGWTSISTLSPCADPPTYAHVSMPGHWGPQLKFAGFDQLIVQGKAERPIYIAIDGEKVRFKDARHLWGKDPSETTLKIYEEKEGRDVEVLCIGPAGENLVPFSNVTNRFSWTGDHIGLGSVFGSKNLKAIVIRGNRPVTHEHSERFLELCRSLRKHISLDGDASRLKEEGTFFFLGKNGGGLGIKNFNQVSSPDLEERWKTLYLDDFLCGREGCFSCPIHCGRVTQTDGDYFGGVHLEAAWSLGPRIGINDWQSTLRLCRVCQKQGLDPCSTGSLLSWMMDGFEERVLSNQDLEGIECHWGDAEAALRVIDRIVNGKEMGKTFRQGGLRAARRLGKGSDRVAHSQGMDLPIRDPRSSMEYAVGLALFPAESDYLRSIPSKDRSFAFPPGVSGDDGIAERVRNVEDLKILADLTSLCPLTVARLSLISASDIAEMTTAVTGTNYGPSTLLQIAEKTMQFERRLSGMDENTGDGTGALPPRFFGESLLNESPLSKDLFDREISRFYQTKESNPSTKTEKEK